MRYDNKIQMMFLYFKRWHYYYALTRQGGGNFRNKLVATGGLTLSRMAHQLP